MEWKNLDEKPVYENPWFKVNLADIELPNGRHLDHYVIRQRPVALTAAVNEKSEVLLLWRHRFITDTWGWELPADVVDDGETVEQAAAREMLEETGWRAGSLHKLMTVEPSNGAADCGYEDVVDEWPDDQCPEGGGEQAPGGAVAGGPSPGPHQDDHDG